MLFLTHPVAVFTSDLRRLDSECLFFLFFQNVFYQLARIFFQFFSFRTMARPPYVAFQARVKPKQT